MSAIISCLRVIYLKGWLRIDRKNILLDVNYIRSAC
jgi:hypothetical protein